MQQKSDAENAGEKVTGELNAKAKFAEAKGFTPGSDQWNIAVFGSAGKPNADKNPTEASIMMDAARGDPAAQKALKLMTAQKIAGRPPATEPAGNWQLKQDATGNVMFNSKTGEVRKAPVGALTIQQSRTLNAATNDYQDAQSRYNRMVEDVAKSKTEANPGSYDMDLLSQHIAMTFGSVKGARTGRDLIEHHIAARSLPENLVATYTKLKEGGFLSESQRQNFLHLGATTLEQAGRKREALKSTFGGEEQPTDTPKKWETLLPNSKVRKR
jgi:hypothetical protein